MAIKIWRVSRPGAGDEYFDHLFSIVTTEDSAAYAVPEVDGKPLYNFTQERIESVVSGMVREGKPLPRTNLEWAQIAAIGMDRFSIAALTDAKNDNYATAEQAIVQEADTALEAFERRNRGAVADKDEETIDPSFQKLSFSPENPQNPRDLFVYGDTEIDQAAILMYNSTAGLFYRDGGQWNVITNDDNWEFDTDGLIIFYVKPSFISRYDEAEAADDPISLGEVSRYESVGPVEVSE